MEKFVVRNALGFTGLCGKIFHFELNGYVFVLIVIKD
jgi:hypothetical protein